MLKILFITLALSSCLLAEQFTPIPAQPSGITYGAGNPVLQLDLYFDFLCSNSAYSFSQLMPVLEQLNYQTSSQIKTVIHITNFPWFHNSQFFGKAYQFVHDNLVQQNDLLNFINTTFAQQANFANSATLGKTDAQVQYSVAQLVHNALPSYSLQNLLLAFANNTITNEAYSNWQYVVSQGVSATPMFAANGIFVFDANTYTSANWTNFISQYVNTSMVNIEI